MTERSQELTAPKSGRPRLRTELTSQTDRTNRNHFGFKARSGMMHLSGDHLLNMMLKQKPLQLCDAGYLLLALAFDGVVADLDTLRLAWQSLPAVYHFGPHACVEWLDISGLQQRRALSAVTRASLSRQQSRASFEIAAAQLLNALGAAPGFGADIESVLSLVRMRLATALPGDLLAHVIGDHPLAAVHRDCLVRLETRLALDGGGRAPATSIASPLHLLVADSVYAARAGSDSDDALDLVREIGRACRADATEANPATDRRRMWRDLERLAPDCQTIGGWPSSIWLWAVNLVTRGTTGRHLLSPNTIDPYINLVVEPLHCSLRDVSIQDAESIDWPEVYKTIIEDSPTPSQNGKIAAALTAWHYFQVEHLGIPPLGTSLEGGPVATPRANIVWPHERAWIMDHLIKAGERSRLGSQLAAVASILFSAAVRGEDLWHIHVSGVLVTPHTVILYIDPLPGAGVGKSSNARRAIEITEPVARELIGRWYARRRAEEALETDLLFGSPGHGSLPHRVGSTHALLNRWLKTVTGDPRVSIHTTRHAALSLARSEIGITGQRTVDESSAQAGHGSTQMSLDHYVHFYELPLRHSLDALWRQRPLTEAQACALSGVRPGCLRQRWRRQPELTPLTTMWQAIDAATLTIALPSVTDGFAVGAPEPVALPGTEDLTPATVLAWLRELAEGVRVDVLAQRHELSQDQVVALRLAMRAWKRQGRQRATSNEPTFAAEMALPFQGGFLDTSQPKLAAAIRALRRGPDRPVLHQLTECWLDVLHGDFISLMNPDALVPLLRWLQDAGMRSEQLVVCHSNNSCDEGEDAGDVIRDVFGSAPGLRAVGHRHGRPEVYLMLRSETAIAKPYSNAALSVAGLNAILFSIWVWLRLTQAGAANG